MRTRTQRMHRPQVEPVEPRLAPSGLAGGATFGCGGNEQGETFIVILPATPGSDQNLRAVETGASCPPFLDVENPRPHPS